jgi:hypothetical protein
VFIGNAYSYAYSNIDSYCHTNCNAHSDTYTIYSYTNANCDTNCDSHSAPADSNTNSAATDTNTNGDTYINADVYANSHVYTDCNRNFYPDSDRNARSSSCHRCHQRHDQQFHLELERVSRSDWIQTRCSKKR